MKKILVLLTAILVVLSFTLALESAIPKLRSAPPRWEVLCDDATATVYHAVPAQCNADVIHTASMFTIDPETAGEYHIVAMERTMMAQYGIAYGDTIRVEGTDVMDGLWRVEDTMNRRYANQHHIDFLVDRTTTSGKWNNVRIYRKTKSKTYRPRRMTI